MQKKASERLPYGLNAHTAVIVQVGAGCMNQRQAAMLRGDGRGSAGKGRELRCSL